MPETTEPEVTDAPDAPETDAPEDKPDPDSVTLTKAEAAALRRQAREGREAIKAQQKAEKERQKKEGEWQKLVCEDLLLPSFKISRVEAVGRRLRRNYGFIFGIVLFAWITKIFLHAEPRIDSWRSFYVGLHVGTSIPSWLVAAVLVGTIAGIATLIIYVGKKSSGEISEFGAHRSLWRI